MYRIEVASRSNLDEWQSFVDSQRQSHALHHSGWFHVLVGSSAVKPLFLMARADDGAIVGVMPAYLSRSAISGAHVTTLDGGILAAHPAAAATLVEHAREHLIPERAKYFLLRGALRDDGDAHCGDSEYVVSVVDTRQSSDHMWERIKKKTRWYIRQGEKQGFSVRQDPELANIDTFYALYAAHVHRLGTPVMGKGMMRAMVRYLGPQRLRLLLVERSGRIVGGMLMVVANRGFLDLYALVRHDLRDTAAGYLLYWKALELASCEQAAELNLGRSAVGSGTHLFKMKWGGRDEPLVYRYYSAPGTGRVDGLEKYHGKETLVQRVWRRLPLWVANRIGPVVRRQLPFG
jgi:FemAB-related protein (PEP-CTERM system-associated)